MPTSSWAEKKFLGGYKPAIEGSVSADFNAMAYLYGEKKPAGSKAEEDALMIRDDLANNLLMATDAQNKTAYKQTDFKHKRV